MSTHLKTQSYIEQRDSLWPTSGKHILAQFDDNNVVVYQAYCPEIAQYAIQHGKFGGDKFSFTRMTWIKTNFLWMMYRSGWASKKQQERILAITISQQGFDEILEHARGAGITRSEGPDEVRLQWDPDHDPKGDKCERRAIQLGLRGSMVLKFNDNWIQSIEDVTEFAKTQHMLVLNNELDKLVTPHEREYFPAKDEISAHILLEGFGKKNSPVHMRTVEAVSVLEGACCLESLEEEFQRVLAQKMEQSKGRDPSEIILCLGGAFNPIHTRHIEVMVQTKKWMEENTNFRVISGYFAVAPDGYVKRKCRKSQQKFISAEHRIRLCQIASADIDWLHVYSKSVGSAGECGSRVKYETKSSAEVGVIVGADRAVNKSGHAKWHKKNGKLTICVGRKGETETMKKAYFEDVALGLAETDNFVIIPQELDNVSSTDVRKMLSCVTEAGDDASKTKAMQDIVDFGWLSKDVSTYILQHLHEIYAC